MKNTLARAIGALSPQVQVPHLVLLAVALSLSVVIWQLMFHVAFVGERNTLSGHLVHVLGDTALLFPLAVIVIVVGLQVSSRLGLDFSNWSGIVSSASIISVIFVIGAVPGVSIHGNTHLIAERIVESQSDSPSVSMGDSMLENLHADDNGFMEAGRHGFHDAAISHLIVLPITIWGLLLLSNRGNLSNDKRRQAQRE